MPAIECDIWNPPDEKGYVTRRCGRPLGQIARDIAELIEQEKCPCDYWSTGLLVGTYQYPKGDPFLRLEVGPNEGYALIVGVREWKETECRKYRKPVDTDMIRFKLLLTRDDAIKAHNVVWIALCSNV